MKSSRKRAESEAYSIVQKILSRINSQHELSVEIEALAKKYGEWVKDDITNQLTEGVDGTYPQELQDHLRKTQHGGGTGRNESTRLAVVSLESLPPLTDLPDSQILELLGDLVAREYHNIWREAGMTAIERDSWRYWMSGYTPAEICMRINESFERGYRVNTIRKILTRTRMKVWNCPSLGWLTTLLESIHRGKHASPPARISWTEIIQSGHHNSPKDGNAEHSP